MINEFLFFLQIFTLGFALLLALPMGKEYCIALIALQALLANLFISEEITLFGLSVTATDAFTIGIILGLNFLQEYWGKEIARTALLVSFATTMLTTALMFIHLAFIPTVTDTAHIHFFALFSATPRIIGASLFSYFISQSFDYYFFGLLRTRFGHLPLIVRSFATTTVSQLIDTVLFTTLALYGNVSSVVSIIAFSFCIKIVALTVSSPFVLLSKKYVNARMQAS